MEKILTPWASSSPHGPKFQSWYLCPWDGTWTKGIKPCKEKTEWAHHWTLRFGKRGVTPVFFLGFKNFVHLVSTKTSATASSVFFLWQTLVFGQGCALLVHVTGVIGSLVSQHCACMYPATNSLCLELLLSMLCILRTLPGLPSECSTRHTHPKIGTGQPLQACGPLCCHLPSAACHVLWMQQTSEIFPLSPARRVLDVLALPLSALCMMLLVRAEIGANSFMWHWWYRSPSQIPSSALPSVLKDLSRKKSGKNMATRAMPWAQKKTGCQAEILWHRYRATVAEPKVDEELPSCCWVKEWNTLTFRRAGALGRFLLRKEIHGSLILACPKALQWWCSVLALLALLILGLLVVELMLVVPAGCWWRSWSWYYFGWG